MALNSNHLVTLAQMRIWFGVPVATVQAEIDAIYELCINAASDMIERFLDRRLITQAYTVQLDGNAQRTIYPGQWPITSVTAVYDSTSWTWDATTLISSADYVVGEDEITLKQYNFRSGEKNVRVEYTAGYDSPSAPGSNALPSTISHACYMLTEWLYAMRSDRRIGVSNKSKTNESVGFIDGIPAFIAEMLAPYKNDLYISDSRPIDLR